MSSVTKVVCFLLVALSLGQVKSATVTVDPNCGVTIGCFSSDGNFLVTWTQTGGNGVYTIKATLPDNYYVALGFSSDSSMGGDKVIGCAVQSTTVTSFSAINQGHDAAPIQTYNVPITNTLYQDGIIECTLTVDATLQNWVDITQPFYLLIAKGSATFAAGAVTTLAEHHGGDNKFASEQAVSITDIVSIFPGQGSEPLVQAHACFMFLAWVLSASVGILMARYYKPVWEGTLFSQKIWFQVHRGCMVLVLVFTILGFILIFAEEGEWSDIESEDEYLESHPILGVIVMVLTILNPIMALFRPPPGTSKRSIFNWAHLLVGEGGHILAVITIFFGIELYEDSPDSLIYIMIGWVVFHILVEIVLTIMKHCCMENSVQESYDLNGSAQAAGGPPKESSMVLLLKKVILVSYVVVVVVISALLIGLLVQGK